MEIDSEKVHYICYGVAYGKGGVEKDFTIFLGDELLAKSQNCINDTSVEIPESEEPNIDGFLCVMTQGMYL
jgi:hypothetical protein